MVVASRSDARGSETTIPLTLTIRVQSNTAYRADGAMVSALVPEHFSKAKAASDGSLYGCTLCFKSSFLSSVNHTFQMWHDWLMGRCAQRLAGGSLAASASLCVWGQTNGMPAA